MFRLLLMYMPEIIGLRLNKWVTIMKVLGITGGVGSGKSRVLNELNEHYNAYVVEADKLAHELMEPGELIYDAIIEAFGKDILEKEPPNRIDRKKLGEIVFNDRKKLSVLDQITHPLVKKKIKEMIEAARKKGEKLFVIEAALLIQDGYKSICDEIWYIYVDVEERIKRLQSSRGYTREKCISMINSQESEDYYKNNTDYTIYNHNSYKNTSKQLKVGLNKLLGNDILMNM